MLLGVIYVVKAIYISQRVEIPNGVFVEVNGSTVRVRGPKGEISRDFNHARGVYISIRDRNIVVEAYRANRKLKALVGSVASHIENMIIGVLKGYRYKLKIIYSHFPVSIVVDEENKLIRIRNFLGEKSDRLAKIYGDVKVRVEGNDVIIEGINIEDVGLTAASLEKATRVKDLDRRVFLDGIYIYERGVGE